MSYIQLLFDRQSMICCHSFRMSWFGRDLNNHLLPTSCWAQMLDWQSKVLYAIELLLPSESHSLLCFFQKAMTLILPILHGNSVNNPSSTGPCLNHRFFSSFDWTTIAKDTKSKPCSRLAEELDKQFWFP